MREQTHIWYKLVVRPEWPYEFVLCEVTKNKHGVMIKRMIEDNELKQWCAEEFVTMMDHYRYGTSAMEYVELKKGLWKDS